MSGITKFGKSLFAAAFGLTAIAMAASPADARTFERCDRDGDHCVRVHCDSDGDDCWQQSIYYRQTYYHHRGRWECDGDRDSCHYVYSGYEWNPRHWDWDRDRERRDWDREHHDEDHYYEH